MSVLFLVPALPPIEGLAEAELWTNREITTAAVEPESLLILGGGVVGWRPPKPGARSVLR